MDVDHENFDHTNTNNEIVVDDMAWNVDIRKKSMLVAVARTAAVLNQNELAIVVRVNYNSAEMCMFVLIYLKRMS